MTNSARVLLVSGFLGLVLGVQGSLSSADPFDRIVPENATVFMSLKSFTEISKWADTSPLGEAWRSRDMEGFVKKLNGLLEQFSSKKDKNTGISFDEVKAIFQGEIALVVGDPADIGRSGKEIPLALMLDVGKEKDKARDLMKKLVDGVMADGKMRKTEADFRGQKIVLLQQGGDDAKKDESKPPVALCLADDLMIVGASKSFVESTLAARGDSAAKPLANHADYKALREKYGKDAAAFLYLNVGRWLDQIPVLAKENGEMASRIIEMVGFKTMKAVSVSLTLSQTRVTSTIFCLAPGTPTGLMKALWTKPSALRFPAVVPDDASSATVIQVDWDAVYNVIENIARMATSMMMPGQEGAGGQQDPLKMFEQQLNISIRQDIIGALGQQVVTYDRIKKPFSMENGQESTLLFELRDKEKFQRTLDKLFMMVPFFKKTEYLGRSMYTMGGMGGPGGEEGGTPDEDAGGGIGTPALGITETHLVFGMSKNSVEEVIRRTGKEVKSLNDAPGLKALSSEIPPSSILLAYESADGFEYLFYMLKEMAGAPLSLIGESLGGSDEDEPAGTKSQDQEILDKVKELLEALPDGKVFAQQIAGTIGYGFTEDRGIGVTSHLIFKKR